MLSLFGLDNGNSSLIIALIVLVAIASFIHYRKSFTFFSVVIVYYILGLIGSIAFYNIIKTNFMEIYPKYVNVDPLLYYVVTSVILAYPFVFLKAKFTAVEDWGFSKYFQYIAALMAVLSIAPFLECIPKLFSLSADSLVNAYEGNGGGDNVISHYCKQMKNYIQFFNVPLLFYFLSKGSKFRKCTYCCLFAFVCSLLQSLVGGSRGTMVNNFNYLVVLYLIYRNVLDKITLRQFHKYVFVFLAILLSALVAITMARFGGPSAKKNALSTSITMYLGQGPVEFSRGMWDSKVRTEGDNSFSFVKIATGHHSFKDNDERRLYWEKKQYIPNFIFYSLVGDVYSDLGREYTVLFCLAMSIFMSMLFKKIARSSSISVASTIIISFYYEWITMGIMSNCYKIYHLQFFIFVTLLCIGFMKFLHEFRLTSIPNR